MTVYFPSFEVYF
jgi:uncharacterized membrane protein (DUF2068 family)